MDAGALADREDPVVGVVDPVTVSDSPAPDSISSDEFTSVLSAHDATLERGELDVVLDADPALLIAPGEATLAAIARATAAASISAPILPVGSVAGVRSVSPDGLPDALAASLDGDATIRQRAALEADAELEGEADRTAARAVFDLTLVTDEPAAISEFTIRSQGSTVATVRADGVVVATAAGTHGYASSVEAPQLSPAVDAVAVAPIGSFVTQTRQWVLPDRELVLTVDRDEQPVTLVADGRSVGRVPVNSPVAVSVAETVPLLVVSGGALED